MILHDLYCKCKGNITAGVPLAERIKARKRVIMKRRLRRAGIIVSWNIVDDLLSTLYRLICTVGG